MWVDSGRCRATRFRPEQLEVNITPHLAPAPSFTLKGTSPELTKGSELNRQSSPQGPALAYVLLTPMPPRTCYYLGREEYMISRLIGLALNFGLSEKDGIMRPRYCIRK